LKTKPFVSIENLVLALHECRYSGGLAASGGQAGFGYARFTRDYLQAMDDLMTLLPSLVREGFSHIPQEQGVKDDPATEEQLDRLPHQVAQGKPSGLVVSPKLVEDWHYWLGKWGVEYDDQYGFIVYNASDAARYLTVLADYCRIHGGDVLDDQFVHRPTGEIRSVRNAARRVAGWMVRTIEQSDLGLMEVQTMNPKQTSWSAVMRDGMDSYYHPEGDHGEPVNRYAPVAYIENQGIAVGALLAAAEMFPDDPDRDKWLELASAIPRRTMEHFWLPEYNYLAPAVDRDEDGRPRPVKLLSSAPMELLATPFFDELPNRRELVEAIVAKIFDRGFLTPVGVRMLHLDHAALEGDYYPYQGTGAVWGVTQRVIAHGLRRQGLAPLAHDIGLQRLVSGLNRTGKAVEYWLVEREHGWVNYHPYNPAVDTEEATVMYAAERPNQPQLWTITGAMAELLSEEAHETAPAGSWEADLCIRYLLAAAEVPPALLDPVDHTFLIDVAQGKQMARERADRLVPQQR
jgi:hypothetical protein